MQHEDNDGPVDRRLRCRNSIRGIWSDGDHASHVAEMSDPVLAHESVQAGAGDIASMQRANIALSEFSASVEDRIKTIVHSATRPRAHYTPNKKDNLAVFAKAVHRLAALAQEDIDCQPFDYSVPAPLRKRVANLLALAEALTAEIENNDPPF